MRKVERQHGGIESREDELPRFKDLSASISGAFHQTTHRSMEEPLC